MRMRNAVVWILIVNVIGLLLVTGRSLGFRWENFTEKDGLIDNHVRSLYESSDGSIWIGMKDAYCVGHLGLNEYKDGQLIRWDGFYDFMPAFVLGICEDGRGRIWCSCVWSKGCAFLQDGMWHRGFPGYDERDPAYGIALGPDGRLWANLLNSIMWYNPETGEGQEVLGLPSPYLAEHLFVSSNGHIWVSEYDEYAQQGSIYEMDDTGTILRTFPQHFGTLAEAPDGTIWLGQIQLFSPSDIIILPRGLFRLEVNQFVDAGPPQGYPAVAGGPICISTNGELVAAGICNVEADMPDNAILTFDGSNWRYYICPFQRNYNVTWITDVLVDSHARIWVATSGGTFAPGEGLWVLRRGPAIWLSVAVNEDPYLSGDSMAVLIDLVSGDHGKTIDLYLALETPSGELLFYPGFGAEMAPFISGIEIPGDTHLEDYELFSLTLPELPAGTYRWYAACTYTGSMQFASNIASCEWQFE